MLALHSLLIRAATVRELPIRMELAGEGGDEEAAFCDWIETVPIDGVEREFTRTAAVCSV
jgi:hypothetical protein